jgi:hypothetical protein
MLRPSEAADDDLETVTRQARRAAEAGRWDQVAFLYARRGVLLSRTEIGPELARRLLEHDRAIEDRLRLVHRTWRECLVQVESMSRRDSMLAAGAAASSLQGRFKDVVG